MRSKSVKVSIDANILVYAFDLNSPFHLVSRQKIEKLLGSNPKIYLSWQTLLEFSSVVTGSKVTTKSSSKAAWKFIESLLQTSSFEIIFPNAQTMAIFKKYRDLKEYPGPKIYDLFLASTLISNGISVLLTQNDKDFFNFENLKIVTLDNAKIFTRCLIDSHQDHR